MGAREPAQRGTPGTGAARHKSALTAPEYRELQRLSRRRTAFYAEVVRARSQLPGL
jgi:hypothetical protein